jgi:hypothetical protein
VLNLRYNPTFPSTSDRRRADLSWGLFIAVPIIVGEQIVNFTFSNRHISESSFSNPPNESRLKKFANVIKKLRETNQNAGSEDKQVSQFL